MAEGGALRELLAVFDIKLGDDGLKKAQSSIEGIKAQLANFGTVVAGAFAVKAITDFVASTIEMGREIAGSSRLLGLTTDQYQKLAGAAQLSGLSAEDAAMGMKFLNKNVGEALTKGGDSAAIFQKLHVNLKNANGTARDGFDIFNDVAEAISKIPDPMQRTYIAQELMSRSGAKMTKMMAGGKKGLQDLYKTVDDAGGVLDSGFIQESVEAGHEMEKWKMSTRALKVALVADFLPYITKTIAVIRTWVRWFSNLVKTSNIVQTALIALGALGFLKVAASVASLAKSLGMLSSFASGEGIMAKIFSMGEVGLIIAAIAALYLIFEDLYTLFTGGESAIGDTLQDFLGFDKANKIVQDLHQAWLTIGDALSSTGIELGDWSDILSGIILAVTVLVEWWTVLVDIIATVVDTVAFLAKEVVDLLAALGAALSGDSEGASKHLDDMKSDFLDWGNNLHKTIDSAVTAGGNGFDIAAQIPNALQGKSNVDQTNNVHMVFNVDGSMDEDIPGKIRDIVTGELHDFVADPGNQRTYAAGASRAK